MAERRGLGPRRPWRGAWEESPDAHDESSDGPPTAQSSAWREAGEEAVQLTTFELPDQPHERRDDSRVAVRLRPRHVATGVIVLVVAGAFIVGSGDGGGKRAAQRSAPQVSVLPPRGTAASRPRGRKQETPEPNSRPRARPRPAVSHPEPTVTATTPPVATPPVTEPVSHREQFGFER